MASANYSHCVPFLPVKDLEQTVNFFKSKLGFTDEWYWGNPATDAGIGRDGLNLLFVQNPAFVEAVNNANHRMEICLFVSNVDEIYKQIKANRVEVLTELRNEPRMVREFSILDCNGYILRIGEGLENEPLETHSIKRKSD